MKARYLLVMVVLLLPLQVIAADSVPDPQTSVREATDKLLANLVRVKPLYKTDPDKFYAEIKKSLAPFIDFDGFARGVMARFYRRATPQQREDFADKFQTKLIHTYSNALVKFDNQN